MISESKVDVEIDRSVVFILGMHRSGTSALSKMLNLIGCDMPKSLMPATDANAGGYWESTEVMALNDDILQSGRSEWGDWLPFSKGWYDSPVFSSFLDRGITLIEKEFGSSPLFVLKDPRCARLVPFWMALFERKNIRPLIVIPLRNPLEVANSLVDRDKFHPDIASLLWLRHVLDAECETRGANRAFSTYDQLLDNCLQVANSLQERLGISWPGMNALSGGKVHDYIDVGSRHYRISTDKLLPDTMVASWLRDTYAIMLRWASTGEDCADYKKLDIIRDELNSAGPAFVGITQSLVQQLAQVSEIRSTLEQKAAEMSLLTETLATIRDELATAQDVLNQRDQQAVTDSVSRESLQQAHDVALAKVVQTEAELAEAHRLAEESEKGAEARVQEMGSRLAHVESTLHQCEKEIAQTISERDTAVHQNGERVDEIAALSRILIHSQNEIKNLTVMISGKMGQTEWLTSVIPIITRAHWWEKLVSEKYKTKHNHRVLLRRGLFDADAYMTRYPDVIENGMDPLKHYILHGLKEGRSAMG